MLASYKVYLCFIVLSVTVCIVQLYMLGESEAIYLWSGKLFVEDTKDTIATLAIQLT